MASARQPRRQRQWFLKRAAGIVPTSPWACALALYLPLGFILLYYFSTLLPKNQRNSLWQDDCGLFLGDACSSSLRVEGNRMGVGSRQTFARLSSCILFCVFLGNSLFFQSLCYRISFCFNLKHYIIL